MIKELIIGSTNPAKINQIKGALFPLKLKISDISNLELPEIIEDGKTAQENARKKATSYAKFLKKPVLSMDNYLYFDSLPESRQPGINVRCINNRTDRLTDEEMLDYYSKLVSELGEQINGRWKFAICVATPEKFFETTIISPRIFTNKKSSIIIPGYPLESIQIDPETNKYISEMTQTEQDVFWQKSIGDKLQAFIKSINI
jgi:inosine/xanthosine triphosphate pyrophosphatase family protein